MPNYDFTFTEQEVQIILEALADAPYRKAAPVINSIQIQAATKQQESGKKENEEKV